MSDVPTLGAAGSAAPAAPGGSRTGRSAGGPAGTPAETGTFGDLVAMLLGLVAPQLLPAESGRGGEGDQAAAPVVLTACGPNDSTVAAAPSCGTEAAPMPAASLAPAAAGVAGAPDAVPGRPEDPTEATAAVPESSGAVADLASASATTTTTGGTSGTIGTGGSGGTGGGPSSSTSSTQPNDTAVLAGGIPGGPGRHVSHPAPHPAAGAAHAARGPAPAAEGRPGPSGAGIEALLGALRLDDADVEPDRPVTAPADLIPDPSPLTATAPAVTPTVSQAATPAATPGDPAGTRAAAVVNGQLVDVIRPLRHDGHGRYDLRVDLHPAELGRVRLDVTFEAGVVHVTLHADQGATNQLLQQSLGELRQALEQAGVATGQLAMGTEGSGPGTQDPTPTSGPTARTDAPGTPEAPPFGPTHRSDGGLDVLL